LFNFGCFMTIAYRDEVVGVFVHVFVRRFTP
jgi:hypothetical protein